MTIKIKNQTLPIVSIVMPVRNEAKFIGNCLRSILRQNYPHKLIEIIIADGISTDKTRDKISQIIAISDISIKVIDNPKRIAPSGLNLAIAQAKGEIIIRIDGHCEIDVDYVKNCAQHLQNNKAECVGGSVQTIGETSIAQAIAVSMSSKFGVGGTAFRCLNKQEKLVDTVAFPAFKRETLEKNGGFNEELIRNQDDEYSYRLRKNGGRILLVADISAKYYSRNSFISLWRQYFQYGYWKVRILQIHPAQMSFRQFVPFIFVSTLILLTIFGFIFNIAFSLLIGIIALYVIVNFIATVSAASQLRIICLPLLSLSFGILHISYGCGFIYGLIAFSKNWNKEENLKTPILKIEHTTKR